MHRSWCPFGNIQANNRKYSNWKKIKNENFPGNKGTINLCADCCWIFRFHRIVWIIFIYWAILTTLNSIMNMNLLIPNKTNVCAYKFSHFFPVYLIWSLQSDLYSFWWKVFLIRTRCVLIIKAYDSVCNFFAISRCSAINCKKNKEKSYSNGFTFQQCESISGNQIELYCN